MPPLKRTRPNERRVVRQSILPRDVPAEQNRPPEQPKTPAKIDAKDPDHC